MAITEMSPGHQYAVASVLKCFQYEQRIDPPRTHDADRSNIWGILQPGNARQIGTGVGAPVTQKSNDLWFKISHYITFVLEVMGYGLRAMGLDNES